MEKFVSCVTKEQCSAVIQRMVAEGCRPINPDHAWSSYSKEVVIRKSNDKHISYANRQWYTDHGYGGRIITAYQYLNKTNKPILITRKGRVVTAEDKNTGDKAIATCCPTDTFDFGTGAMIAVARLIAQSEKGITKDAEVVLRQLLGDDVNSDAPAEEEELINGEHKYVVGDRVRIKAWEVMKGYSNFVSAMRHLCGRTATITNVYYDVDCPGNHSYTIGLKFDDDSGDTCWQYQACMVEPLDESKSETPTTKFKVGDLVTLKDGLEVGKPYGAVDLLEIMYSNGHNKPMKVIGATECEDGDMAYDCAPVGGGRSFWYVEEMLEPWDENKIREGDIVRVVNTGLNYSTYPQWVGKHINDPDMAARYCFSSPSYDGKYKVIKIAEHEDNGRTLAYIEEIDGFCYNSCYLIEVKGLEKVTE